MIGRSRIPIPGRHSTAIETGDGDRRLDIGIRYKPGFGSWPRGGPKGTALFVGPRSPKPRRNQKQAGCPGVHRSRRPVETNTYGTALVDVGAWRCRWMAVHWCGSVNTDGLSARGESIKYSRPEGTQGRATYILRRNLGCGQRPCSAGERHRSSPTDGHPSKILKPRGSCGVTLRSPTRCEKSLHVPTPRGWDGEFESRLPPAASSCEPEAGAVRCRLPRDRLRPHPPGSRASSPDRPTAMSSSGQLAYQL